MRFGNVSRRLCLAMLAVIGSPMIQAQDPGWYLGANLGQSRARIDDPGIGKALLGSGYTPTGIDDRTKSTGGKLFGGYRFSPYFALEGGYFNLGHFGYTAALLPAGTLDGTLKYQGLNLDAVGFLPLGGNFSLFARAGVTYGQAKDAFTGTGSVVLLNPDPRQSAFGGKAGGGLQYDVNRHIALRAEVERYRMQDAIGNRGDLDLASLGVLVRFGGAAPTHVAADTQPAPEPLATPAPVIAVFASKTDIYCSLLDIEFDIDKDDLQLEDKEKLKVVGVFMTRYPETTAVIEGYADNVGSDAHNLELSRHRADAVVNYLMDAFKLSASRLSAVGYGSTRPVGDNATESGKRQNRHIDAVISCATDLKGLEVAPARLTMALLIEFDPNESVVKAEYDGELAKVARYLKDHPKVIATVEGHTGNLKGTPEQAMAISLERAQRVVAHLETVNGIASSRLMAVGFGEGRRYAYNTTPESRQENRRVNIIFSYPK